MMVYLHLFCKVRRIQQHTQVEDDGLVTFDIREEMRAMRREKQAGEFRLFFLVRKSALVI